MSPPDPHNRAHNSSSRNHPHHLSSSVPPSSSTRNPRASRDPPSQQHQHQHQRCSNMLSLFNIIRTSVYGAVILFTFICLAMAGHFQHVLAASDLTRFVPFSIFVCSTSLFIVTLLLGFSFFLRDRNPISTRIELSALGLLGFFWLVLGLYLAKSDSQDADVECFAPGTSTSPLPDSAAGFHTDQYQAMYRVLNTFAMFNAILVLFFCIGLLFLAIQRQRKGDDHMWHGPVTSCAWFNRYGQTTVKRGPSTSSNSSILPLTLPPLTQAKPARTRYTERRMSGVFAGKRHLTSRDKPLPPGPMRRQNSGSSSMIGSFTPNDFERGGMMNPNVRSHGRR